MQFEEALKNSNAYKSLAKDADTGNVAHAYMFVSPDETALLSLAELSALRLFAITAAAGSVLPAQKFCIVTTATWFS